MRVGGLCRVSSVWVGQGRGIFVYRPGTKIKRPWSGVFASPAIQQCLSLTQTNKATKTTQATNKTTTVLSRPMTASGLEVGGGAVNKILVGVVEEKCGRSTPVKSSIQLDELVLLATFLPFLQLTHTNDRHVDRV